MTLRTRLALGILAIALLVAAPLGLALRALGQSERAARELKERDLSASFLLARVRSGTVLLRQWELNVLFVRGRAPGEPDGAEQMRAQMDSLRVLGTQLERLGLRSFAATLDASLDTLDVYGPREAAAAATRAGSTLADSLSDWHIGPAITRVERALAPAEEGLALSARGRTERAAAAAAEAQVVAATLLAAAALGTLLVAVWLARSIARPVAALERGMAAVAAGHFDHALEVNPHRGDEFGRLATSYARMAEQLTELDKLKAEFVSVASHELKTPIHVILGYVSLLEEGLYGPLADEQRTVLRTVAGQAQSLGRLVQHLLDVSRFQAGAARLALRPLALRPFLREVEASYRVLAMQRGLEFTVTADASLPDVVTWDPDRMNEVLTNLLSNAIKFTPRGRVDVVARGEPGGPSGAGRVRVEVRDTGVGIPEAELPRVFGKFFQADNQHAASLAGTGLGLAIAKEIVEAHGGTIAVESTVGVGSCFVVSVPAEAVPRDGDRPAPLVTPSRAQTAIAATPATADGRA